MKWLRKILAVCSFCTLLTTVNCFAMTEEITFSDDSNYCYKTYQIQEEEEKLFLEMLEKEITVGEQKYKYINYDKSGGNVETIIDISQEKTILSKTKNIDNIIEQLGETIKYEENGFVGEYTLNPNTLKITTNENGFREVLIEKTITYTNLEKNDLSFIPKETQKNGLTLNLLNVEWEVETTKEIGSYIVPNTYIGKGYYATKQRIDYPDTYTVTGEYFGTATKIEENPISITVKYEKIVEDDKEEINILPVAGGISGILVIVLLFFTGNITVYNYKNEQWKKVGKARMKRNNKIKLDRFSLIESSNKYKLVFSKRLTQKVKGKMITISKNNTTKQMLANVNNQINYTIETRI